MSLNTHSDTESPWLKKYDPQKVKLGREIVEVIDAAPENVASPIPIVYAPGWNPDVQVLRQVMPEIIKAGRRGITFSAPHGIDDSTNDPEMRKADAVLALLETKKLGKIDAIGHSEAGLYLVEAALKEPEKFRSILLVNPVGIIGPDSLPKLAVRFVQGTMLDVAERCRDLLQGKHQEHSRLIRHIVRGARSSFSPYAPQEALAMASRQIPEKLRTLREKGIHICIVRTKDDKAFPTSRSALNSSEYDALIEVEEGGHDFPIVHPEKFIPIAVGAFDKLAGKKR